MQEAGKIRPEIEWPPQSLLHALDFFRRAGELRRMETDADPERAELRDALEALAGGVLFCRICLLAIAVLLGVIALRL